MAVARAGDDQHGDDGADLCDGTERSAGTAEVGCTDLAQENVDGEADQHRERDCDQHRRHHRDSGHEPGLIDELLTLEGAGEDCPQGLGGHLKEATDRS